MIDIQVPSIISMYGQTASGKTYRLKELLKNELKNKYDYIYIFSPTLKLSKDFDEPEFKETDGKKKSPIGAHIKHFDDPSTFLNLIKEIYKAQDNLKRNYPKEEVPQICLIIDDCIAQGGILKFGGFLDSKSISTRHWNVSLIILSQRIAGVGRNLRLNSSYCILFSCFNYSELERYMLEYIPQKYKASFSKELEEIFNVPYNYILCNNKETRLFDRLLLNGKDKIDLKELLSRNLK